jgi:preprotein translocase subunit YajC
MIIIIIINFRCRPIEESFWIRIFMFVVMMGLIVALILQAQQTEVTSRLDFLWKLQATG